MGMYRIVLTDGSVMHLTPGHMTQDGGALILKTKTNGVLAIFAPGVWRSCLWVVMEAP